MNTNGQISEINFNIGDIFICEWTLPLRVHASGANIGTMVSRTVRVLVNRILARPILWFCKHPEALDLKFYFIAGTRLEIESLKQRGTRYRHGIISNLIVVVNSFRH